MESLSLHGATEDDTFERLRRISIGELEARHDWLCQQIFNVEHGLAQDKRLNDNMDSNVRLLKKLTFGLVTVESVHIHSFSASGTELLVLRDMVRDAWNGTGWTYEAYAEIQRAKANELLSAVHAAARKSAIRDCVKFGAMSVAMTTMYILAGMSLWFAIPLGLLSGYGGDYIWQIFTERSMLK